MNSSLLDYYRLPPDLLPFTATATGCTLAKAGFFQFGRNNICYGQCQTGTAADLGNSVRFDASQNICRNDGVIRLPFDFTEIVENLRLERYREQLMPGGKFLTGSELVRTIYYFFRDYLPLSVRRQAQAVYLRDWNRLLFPAWPVDFTVDTLHEELLRLLMETSGAEKVPFIWFWPDGAPNCLMMTHDVETSAGRDFTSHLMDLDDSYEIKASFQVIPEERYEVPDDYIHEIQNRGFEFNVHDLNHDGTLYRERREFLRRAAKINGYVRQYNTHGFRSGAMYRNQDWYDAFEFSYDMSVPNVAHLEAMRGGCCTVMPYFVGKIVELPLTTVQDYSLFHILKDYSIDLWSRQLALIGARHGLMSIIAHPDYLIEPRARAVYESLLHHLRQMIARDKVWAALPGEVDHWWRVRSRMQLVRNGDDWEIEGPEKERARVAYAVLDRERLHYEITNGLAREGMNP